LHGKKLNMKFKNKRLNATLLLITLLFVLTGCKSKTDSFINEVNSQINVLGVNLNMPESEVHKIVGSSGERAMCVYGYEYEFMDKQINVGFNSNTEKTRRITTKNPETSIYGIKPGVSLEEAYSIIEQNGFKKSDDSKYIFYKENIILTLISMKGINADGITIEIKPE